MSQEELLQKISQGIVKYDRDTVEKTVKECLKENLAPVEIMLKGLMVGIKAVCQKMRHFIISTGECLLSIEAFQAGLQILEPHLGNYRSQSQVRIVIGVIEGDIHDIGKNIVKMMLRAANFEVHDLGRDVPISKFIQKAQDIDAKVIALSTLMTTTMPNMGRLIKELESRGIRDNFKVIVGGTPLSWQFAKQIGADGYGEDAAEAVEITKKLLEITNNKTQIPNQIQL